MRMKMWLLRYQKMKEELESEYADDRVAYTHGKQDMIDTILNKSSEINGQSFINRYQIGADMNENYNQLDQELNHLVQIIARLRAEDGCPWDREQTHWFAEGRLCGRGGGGGRWHQHSGADRKCGESEGGTGGSAFAVVMHAQIAKEGGIIYTGRCDPWDFRRK